MKKVFDYKQVTVKSVIDQALLAVHKNNKDVRNFEELLTLVLTELEDYYILMPLNKPKVDSEGNLITKQPQRFSMMLNNQDRRDIRSAISRILDCSIIPENNPFIHKPNNNKFIKAALKIFPNIDAYNVGASLTSLRLFIQNIYYNLGFPGLKPQQKSLYLYSVLGGTGKSEFLKRLKIFLESKKLSYTASKPVGRWVGAEYSGNLVDVVDEWMPPKGQDKDLTISRLNNIIDNVLYDVEYKGENRYQVKSKSTLVFTSNFKPFDTNDRRYGIIQYNEVPYSSIEEEDLQKYFPERSNEEWNQIFTDLFESVPFNKIWKDKKYHNSDTLNELIWMAKDIVKSSDYTNFDVSSCTIREFVSFYMKMISVNGAVNTKELKEKLFIIKQCIRKSVANKLIKPAKWTNGNVEYSKYDLTVIAKIPTSEDDIENPLNDIENLFEKTRFAFNAFLEEEKPVSPDDNQKVLKDGNLFVDKFVASDGSTSFRKCETTNKGQEYVVVNMPLPHNDGTSRKNCDVEQNCFLLEIDAQKEDKDKFERENPDVPFKGSKEEKESADRAIITFMGPFYENYKDCLKWVCKSGRVSIHAVLKTNLPKDCINPSLRAYVFERINKTYFNNTLDGQCKNAGRLARNPNAVRDNGIIQSALIINENCNEMDVRNWIKEYEELQKIIKPTVQYDTTKVNDTSIEALERMVNATKKESGILALALARGERVASGENLIGAIGYMKTLADHNPEWTELYHRVWNEAHLQHPSNIGSPAK